MQKSVKINIKYFEPTVSALAIQNTCRALGHEIVLTKMKTAAASDFSNVELKAGDVTLSGELTIATFLANQVNLAGAPLQFLTQGAQSNWNFDQMLYALNTRLRVATQTFLAANGGDAVAKETIKQIAKEMEESGLLQTLSDKQEYALAAAFAYSYLEPVQKLMNNKVKLVLKSLQEKNGFVTYDALVKEQIASAQQTQGKNVSVSASNAKIRRVNPDKIILPEKGKRNILITSALPYVNNVPHLGNIIGCVLSADVFARYCRLVGHNAIYICGTDEYGTATETKALQEGKTCKEICDYYHAIHDKIYKWFDCDFDKFGRTTTDKQTEICHEIFNHLREQGNTFEKVIEQQFCPKCQRFLADRFVRGTCPLCGYHDAKGDQCDGCGKLINATELINPSCTTCNGTPEPRESKHIFIDLPKIQPVLEEWIAEQKIKGAWSQNSITFSETLLKQGLQGRCITRDLKWGTAVPVKEFADKVFYVWFDAPIGYISITANHTDDWRQWWQQGGDNRTQDVELFQFMGKDNITFHTVIFPSTLIGSGQPWTKLHTISTTEFLNYEIDEKTGKPKKFSKSRNTGVFGDNAMNTGIPSEVWRYYLLINRPENQDAVFTWSDFIAKNNNELLANLGNFANRFLKFVAGKQYDKKMPGYKGDLHELDAGYIAKWQAHFAKYIDLMEKVSMKDALRTAMEFSSECNAYLQESQPFAVVKTDLGRCSQILALSAGALYTLCAMLEPFMPSFSAKVYDQMNIKRTEVHENFLERLQKDFKGALLTIVPADHVIGNPEPIFRKIEPEEGEAWKKQFGGNE